MYLPFSIAILIILSLLATESMAQNCGVGLFNESTDRWKPLGNCDLNHNNVYFCGSTGASGEGEEKEEEEKEEEEKEEEEKEEEEEEEKEEDEEEEEGEHMDVR
ncbi:hypothetical protein EG327_005118 [Venturia inaequalis]|uniref:Uncharacterized protein n=1 Tax=Venturia inaequalis TaxID=5025 RepID=A0A8H3VW81_VENIN|nr:hypothetical protein EG327_005118 [Venturia inaequalis]